MSKKKRILIIVLSIVLFLVVLLGTSAYFLFLHRYKGHEVVNEWHETDAFNIDDIATIEKDKDKEFVILNLADIQMEDLWDIFKMNTIHREITYLVETTKPDLITLTGDQTWSNENLVSLKTIIRWLDEYKIPYAPVFGNHDLGNKKDSAVVSTNYACDLYEKGKYSLFKRGPSNIGTLGNYVINIKEDGKIYKTLYMLDAGYEDIISDEQIAWVKWNAEGIRANNGGSYSEGMVFMHKPIPEYVYAFYGYNRGNDDVEVINDVHVHYSLSGTSQNGFFDMAKSINVLDIVCGHQHGNNFTLRYEGVRLTFAMKTGELGGYYDDGEINLNGATRFTLHEGATSIDNIRVKSGEYHFKDTDNVYND